MHESSPPPTGEGAPAGAVPSPSMLVAALERLDGHSRDLLEVSMRRRTPDDVLARLLHTDRLDVSRRRAAAISSVSEACEIRDALGLGGIMRGLLDGETWSRYDGASVIARRGPDGEGSLAHLRAARLAP